MYRAPDIAQMCERLPMDLELQADSYKRIQPSSNKRDRVVAEQHEQSSVKRMKSHDTKDDQEGRPYRPYVRPRSDTALNSDSMNLDSRQHARGEHRSVLPETW